MSATLGAFSAGDELAFRSIVARAAARFRPEGRGPSYLARGKLGGDPVFRALLRNGLIASRARVLDLGCGPGMLPALLAAAEQTPADAWPATWAPPAAHWTLHGIDLRRKAIETGRRALSDLSPRVQLSAGDLRRVPLPACDVAVLLDVLHYIDADAQRAVLARVHAALAPSGRLLLRVGDAVPTWRFRFSLFVDWCVISARGSLQPRFCCRPLAQWISLLETIGFAVTAQPMSEGTPFANVLLIATRA